MFNKHKKSVGKCKTKEFEQEIFGYNYYIIDEKNTIRIIFGNYKTMLRIDQKVYISKDQFESLPEGLLDRQKVVITRFRKPSYEDPTNSIVEVSFNNIKKWVKPSNIKTH
ncbi:hypothetical protein K9M42_01000 [Patescibacteria group bacterium]|nr:hypothetical protein [Patescibacteria group bacterium]